MQHETHEECTAAAGGFVIWGGGTFQHRGFGSTAEALAFAHEAATTFKDRAVRRLSTTAVRSIRRTLAGVDQPLAAPATRPREHRAPRRARARSPGASDEGSERPRRAERVCESCGELFQPSRESQHYCLKPDCRKARHAANVRAGRGSVEVDGEPVDVDPLWSCYTGEVRAARRLGEIGGHEAASLLVEPSDRVQAALAVRELVTRAFAALDSGRLDVARRAATPIAWDICVELGVVGT